MSFSEAIRSLNVLKRRRVIRDYAIMGAVAATAYMLKVIRQVLLGPLKDAWRQLSDLSLKEIAVLCPLLIATLAIGVYPLSLLRVQEGALQQLLLHVLGH